MRPAKLWRSMLPEARAAAARAFWTDENAALEQAEAIALIARQIKFRPRSVQALPVDKRGQVPGRHRPGVRSAGGPAAGRLPPRVPAADDGRVPRRARHHARPGADRGGHAQGADARGAGHGRRHAGGRPIPKADVARYFWTLLWQDPDTWGALQDRPELAEHRLMPRSRTTSSSAATGARTGIRAAAATRPAPRRCTRPSSRPWPSAACSAACAPTAPAASISASTARPWSSIPRRSGTAASPLTDVAEIVDRHLVGGEPVARLRLRRRLRQRRDLRAQAAPRRDRPDSGPPPWTRCSPPTT